MVLLKLLIVFLVWVASLKKHSTFWRILMKTNLLDKKGFKLLKTIQKSGQTQDLEQTKFEHRSYKLYVLVGVFVF
jgi:hypothetical protein